MNDDLSSLPEASADDHAFVWSFGDFNDSIVAQEWKMTAVEVAVRVDAGEGRLPVIAFQIEGLRPGPGGVRVKQLVLLPLDVAGPVADSIKENIEQVERNDRARIVARNEPPKEPPC